MNDSVIEVALASDRRFYPGLLVTAYSIAENANRDYDIVFHILDGGIGDELRHDLESQLNSINPKTSVDWLDIDHNAFKDLPEWRGCGRMAWARLLLPSLLSNTPWVVYYDVDFLCLADVSELWALRDDCASLMSTREDWPLSSAVEELEWSVCHNLSFDVNRHLCSGFCFFNLKRIRQKGFDAKMLDVALNDCGSSAIDQFVLNVVFHNGELKLLPRKWQAFTRDMTESDIVSRHNLHYAGEAPWVCLPKNWILDDASVFWFRYYARLRGISTWNAMREFYSVGDLIKYRALYMIFSRIPLMRKLLHSYFRAIKHEGSIVVYDALLHRFRMP